MVMRNLGRGSCYQITELDSGILGLCIGDALGVPVEFSLRDALDENPVEDMRGYGTFYKPPGTWSDDTSLTLCLANSLAQTGDIDYQDIMRRFSAWLNKDEYTSDGDAFDVGETCRRAIRRFDEGTEPLRCGDVDERTNGNGSLMRILPLVFYLHSRNIPVVSDRGIEAIHNVSALTHAHSRSKISCVIYCRCAEWLIDAHGSWRRGIKSWSVSGVKSFLGKLPVRKMQNAIREVLDYYTDKPSFADEVGLFQELVEQEFVNIPRSRISSGGYVLDTLKTALWCLWNNHSFRDTTLAAVNLAGNTDTNAAVAGGLAGIWYGFDSGGQGIPQEWEKQIVNKRLIDRICRDLSYCLGYNKDIIVEEPDENSWCDAEMEDIADRFRGYMLGIAASDKTRDVTRLMLLTATGMAGAKERFECRGIGDYFASGTVQAIEYWRDFICEEKRKRPEFCLAGTRTANLLREQGWLFERGDGIRKKVWAAEEESVAGLASIGLFLFDSPEHSFELGNEVGEILRKDTVFRSFAGVYTMIISLLVNDAGDIDYCVELAKEHLTCVQKIPESKQLIEGLNERLSNPVLQAGLRGAALGTNAPDSASIVDKRLLTAVEETAAMLFDEKNCYYLTDLCEKVRNPQRRTKYRVRGTRVRGTTHVRGT